MGLSLRSIGKKFSQVYDQANVFDAGRTYKQRTPTKKGSAIHQATHSGLTNAVGDVVVKPAARIPFNVSNTIYNNAVAPALDLPKLNTRQSAFGNFAADKLKATGKLTQTGGDIIQTAANVAMPGSSAVVKNAFRNVAPKFVPDIALRATANAGVGAVGGGVNNVGYGLSENKIKNFQDFKNQALTGAKFGAVLGGGGTLALPVVKPVVKAGGKTAVKGGKAYKDNLSLPALEGKIAANAEAKRQNILNREAAQGRGNNRDVKTLDNQYTQLLKEENRLRKVYSIQSKGIGGSMRPVKNEGIEKAVEKVMIQKGVGREAATLEVDKMLRASVRPGQELYQESAARPVIYSKKDPEVKRVLEGLSRTKAASHTERDLTANVIRTAAKKEGVRLDRSFIDKYQVGALESPAEKRVGAVIKKETDRIFKQQQKIDDTIEYRKNYVPQTYKQDAQAVEEAAKQLQTRTGSSERRAFKTYQEATEFGLSPHYNTLDQMIGANAAEARMALGNRGVINTGLQSGIFTAKPTKGLSAIDGFYDHYGNQIFASKKVADIINGVMQDSTTGLGKFLDKSKEFNGAWQDIALSGGIPATPLNFFTFGQVVKDLSAGRFSVSKDLFYSMSERSTARRFAENEDFVRKMADRGVPFRVQSSLTNAESNKLASIWGQAVNQPTFQRFMPNQYLSLSQNVYKKLAPKVGEEQALDIAADTTKKFYGIIDHVAKGRDKNTHNAIGSVFFAARYRESILNTLFNTAKSVAPKNIKDPSYAMNRRLLAGMAITAVGYDQLNRQINGHGMFDNREGQELSLQIPYGEKDEKGGQKVANVPFMPSFLTVPRIAFNATNSARKGDTKGVISEGGKLLSQPINTGAALASNKNYFGEPIVVDQETADKEGVSPDSSLVAAKKRAEYVAGQASPGWVRAGIAQAQGKSPEKVAATALEAPVRFGKLQNPDTQAFIERKEAMYKTANKNEKAALDKLFPARKNVLGEDIKDTNPNTSIERATLLRSNKGVFNKVSRFYKDLNKQTGQAIDPVYTLPWDKAQSVLWARSLPPGESSETKDELLYSKPWYAEFKKQQDSYYASLEKKFGKKDDPYGYPTESPVVSALQQSYYGLPKGTGARSDFLESNPELQTYFDARSQAVNKHRVALGLPKLPGYTSTVSTGSKSSGGSSGGRRSSGRSRGGSNASAGSVYKYAVSLNAGGKTSAPKVSVKKGKTKKAVARKAGKPKVSIKKSLV